MKIFSVFFSKIHNYSQTDAKTYDKPVQRKFIVTFNPETVITLLDKKIDNKTTKNRTVNKRSRRSQRRHRNDSGEVTSDSGSSSEEEEEENSEDKKQRRKLIDEYLEVSNSKDLQTHRRVPRGKQ
jgi:hypothetical protein